MSHDAALRHQARDVCSAQLGGHITDWYKQKPLAG